MNVINVIGLFTFLVTSFLNKSYGLTVKLDGLVDFGKKHDTSKMIRDLLRHVLTSDDRDEDINMDSIVPRQRPKITKTPHKNTTQVPNQINGTTKFGATFKVGGLDKGADVGNDKDTKTTRHDHTMPKTHSTTTRKAKTTKIHRTKKTPKAKKTKVPKDHLRSEATKRHKLRTYTITTGKVALTTVNNDDKMSDFIIKVYKKSNSFLRNIRDEVNEYKFKHKISYVSTKFREMYKDFVNEMNDVDVRSENGDTKVVLHIVETASNFLTRMLNYVVVKVESQVYLRSHTKNKIARKLNDEVNALYKMACDEFNICRSQENFMNYISSYTEHVLLIKEDEKVRHVIKTFGKHFNNFQFIKFMDYNTEELCKTTLRRTYDDSILRLKLMVLENLIIHRHAPILTSHNEIQTSKIKKLLSLFDLIDESFSPTEENVFHWSKTKSDFTTWVENNANDDAKLENIYKDFFKNVKHNTDSWNDTQNAYVKRKLQDIVSHLARDENRS